ncbi:MAG TPA: MFS transporter [Micromonosporaceae bacterium]|nr:MFS transporter [Micromonosporaceae bacterium]
MSQTVISRTPTSRAILAGSGFRRLLAVRLTSQIADGWFQAGLAGSILFNPNQKTSPIEIAMGFAILLLPYSVLGPYVGVLLDRWDRRASLSVANLARAVLVLPAAALLWAGSQDLRFAVSALLVIAINRFFLAGLSASLPRVVEDEKLVPANALASTLGTICYSIGLFSAAAVITFDLIGAGSHGYGVIAAVASLGYLASGLLARYLFKPESLGPLEHERHTGRLGRAIVEVAQGMIAGARHLAQRRVAARDIALQAIYRCLYGVLTLAVLLLFSRYFGEESTRASQSLRDLAFIVIAGAAGAAVAAVITPPAVRILGANRWLISIVAGVGTVVIAFGLPFNKLLLLLAAFLINVASQSMKIIVDATIQHECDDVYRGRIFSVNDTAYNLCFVGGLFITAMAFPPNGKSVAGLFTVALGFIALSIWFAIGSRRPSAAVPALPPAR